MKKSIPLAALMGVTGLVGVASVADAAAVSATLVSVNSYSTNGSAAWNGTLDTSTWTFDSVTGTAVQTGGTYSRLTKAGPTPLMRHTMTGVSLGNFATTGSTWSCIEGQFGSAVGASICGNYNFGPNTLNESTYVPSTTGATVTQGGDDGIIGPPQTLVNSYSGMNKFGVYATDPTGNNTSATVGYDFVFRLSPTAYWILSNANLAPPAPAVVPAPAAVWLLGTGLVGLAARRLRKGKTTA